MDRIRIISDKPEHQVKNFKWAWCFLCDGIHARCPRCDVNSCACGCMYSEHHDENGECPEQAWWDAQYGEEYEAELAARPRPERDALIKFIQWLESLSGEDDFWKKDMSCDPLNIISHARWHGLDFTFDMSYGGKEQNYSKSWHIKLNSLPTDEPRSVYFPRNVKVPRRKRF